MSSDISYYSQKIIFGITYQLLLKLYVNYKWRNEAQPTKRIFLSEVFVDN